MTSHLFPMGGGSFTGPNGGPSPMFQHMLSFTGKKHPKVCLIHTAGADNRDILMEFVLGMHRLRAHPNFLSLYSTPTADLESWIMEFDAVYVSGGNTRNLLALWREWQLDQALKKAWQRGVVLCGGSAGAICWFEQGCSDFIADALNPIDALGWLPGSVSPHYGDEKGRRPAYHAMVADGRLKPGYGLSNRGVLHYIDGKLHEPLTEHPDFGVFHVQKAPTGHPVETKLEARLIT